MKNFELKKTWTCDIENWHEIQPELARIFLDQAEKELGATEKTFEATTTKTATLLGILIPTMLAALVYLMGMPYDSKLGHVPLFWGIFLMLFPLAFSIALLLTCIHPLGYYNVGYSPKSLMKPNLLNLSGEIQTTNAIFELCEYYQAMIDHNDQYNTGLLRRYKISLYLLFASPIVLGITYILSGLLGCGVAV